MESILQSGVHRQKRTVRWEMLVAAIAACAVQMSPEAAAEEIYRWVDDGGAVHYSDTKPGDDAAITVIEIEAGPAVAYNPEDDPYSILNQAARTHDRWLDLEEARQARAEARAETVVYRDRPPVDNDYDDYLGYGTWYPYSSYFPGNGSESRPGQGRQQIYAMNTLNLLGPRPASINSGVHQERVYRSQFLPLVPPPPVVQPLPR